MVPSAALDGAKRRITLDVSPLDGLVGMKVTVRIQEGVVRDRTAEARGLRQYNSASFVIPEIVSSLPTASPTVTGVLTVSAFPSTPPE